jgi:Secretion system C-terminal sorting domain
MTKFYNPLLTFLCLFLTYRSQAAAITNIKSGSWYDPTVWDLGRVPTTTNGINDIVTIAENTTVTVNGAYTDCDGLIINGFLDVGATNLTIGGRDLQIDINAVRNASVIVNGGLRITGDWSHQFKVYGNVKFNTGSTFEMSAGMIMIDGSAFTESLSVPANTPLLDVTDASSFVSTGGMVVLFNPHFHATGLTIKGAKHFYNVSFGNNLVLPNFACRNTSDFLISETDKPTFSNIRLAYLPHPDRQNLVVLNNVTIPENVELSNGVLVGSGRLKVAGNMLLNSDGRIEMDIECNGNWQQNISTFLTNTSATIKGNIYVNNPDRVKTSLDLDIQEGTIKMMRGKFDLNNNTVSVSSAPTGASVSTYIVSYNQFSNVGTLIVKNLSGPTLFPLGTETTYSPVTLTAANGDFSVSTRPLSIAVVDGRFSINNQWDINRVSGSSPTDVEVQWQTAIESADFSTHRASAKLNRFDGSNWQPLSTQSISVPINDVVHSQTSNIQNFSTFTMLTQAALPITLNRFTGKIEDNQAHLLWETATEFNNAGFDIEKSLNGTTFEPIGFVKGVGNSVKMNVYNFEDYNFTQTAYYRLKQVNFDGKYTYSNIVSLEKIKEKGNLKIYPNPLSNQPFLTIDLSEYSPNQATISIFEANGRLIHQNTEGGDIAKISVNDWAKGLYLIRLTTNDGKTVVSKFVKN